MNKPIRYWEASKIYKWGCDECDMTTFDWSILWMHYKHEHKKVVGVYQYPPDDYTLKELK